MRPPRRVEVAVIGAGPAGSAIAAALATSGRDVVLLERDTFPRHKVCGEFLSPEATRCLDELGCLQAFHERKPAVITRSRLRTADGAQIELKLPAKAYGLSRKCLDEFLFANARDCGAQAFEGAAVRKVEVGRRQQRRLHVELRDGDDRSDYMVEADVVVGAYGRRSRIDRRLKRPFFDKHSPYVAFKRHNYIDRSADVPPLEDHVELHAFDGGYCGVSFVEQGRVNICTMVERRLLRDGRIDPEEPFQSLQRGDTPLGRRLATLKPCDVETCAVAQIPLSTKASTHNGVLFVGDAAGMIAPLAGDGQAMAMESALTLAGLLHDRLPRVPRRQWSREWRQRFGVRVRLGSWLQAAIIRPAIAGLLMRLLGRFPSVARALVVATRGR